jgi:uncharacterized DUF497 family protein
LHYNAMAMLFIRRLRWGDWNLAHIARHEVSRQEVEQACQSDHIYFESYKERLILIGPTLAGRMLAVILEHEGEDSYYVVTARSADRKERRLFREEKGGTKK